MTKERLRAYRELKIEKEQLERLLQSGETEALRDCYREKLGQVEKEQLAIERAIDALESKARTLIRFRYIDGLKWEEVCEKLHYEWAQTHIIHSEALKKLKQNDPGA